MFSVRSVLRDPAGLWPNLAALAYVLAGYAGGWWALFQQSLPLYAAGVLAARARDGDRGLPHARLRAQRDLHGYGAQHAARSLAQRDLRFELRQLRGHALQAHAPPRGQLRARELRLPRMAAASPARAAPGQGAGVGLHPGRGTADARHADRRAVHRRAQAGAARARAAGGGVALAAVRAGVVVFAARARSAMCSPTCCS